MIVMILSSIYIMNEFVALTGSRVQTTKTTFVDSRWRLTVEE